MNVPDCFLTDTTESGIGFVKLAVDPSSDTLTLEIAGDETRAATLGAAQAHPFNRVIYPPKFYVRDADFTNQSESRTVEIDEDPLVKYDIALYLIEHNDVMGTLAITTAGLITFSGTTSTTGKLLPLDISVMA